LYAKDRYSNSDLPEHSSMRLISNSEQNFGQWSRRLVTMEKFRDNVIGEHANIHNARGLDNLSFVYKGKDFSTNEEETKNKKEKKTSGHYLFREKVRCYVFC
jgi:tRNA (guanine10-N2)-methyltransferase